MAKQIYPATDLAEWFVQRADVGAGDVMTHLKVQKLLYYSQAWHLANFNQRLFDEDLEAWTHGPVVPSVWRKYRNAGWQALAPPARQIVLDAETTGYLDHVYGIYGKYSAKVLEQETHKETPWLEARGDLPIEARCEIPINDVTVRNFFAAKIGKSWPTSINRISSRRK